MESFDDISKKKEPKVEETEKEYTLDDLKHEEEWDHDWGANNPGAQRRIDSNHGKRLRKIKADLKKRRLLEYTEKEKLTMELDKIFPNSKSKKIVEHNGKRYQMRYFPLDTSNTGKTVFEWGHEWVLLDK